MTLLVPMYHHARAGRHGNTAAMLDAHFAYIAKTYRCVLPGEALDHERPNVCLSFDDGTYDFHAVVDPLLDQTVDSFVLPYGRFTPAVVDEVRRHYRYVFRIGSADNFDWNGRCIYRVDADAMQRPDALSAPSKLLSYRFRQRWNALRGR